MARSHVWKFLVNQVGEPIEDAQIYVTLAGTDDAVWVYFDEFSASGTRETSDTVGQTTTLENGYFEFWIDENVEFDPEDLTDDNPDGTTYNFNQKFKIRWQKSGVSNGYVDYVDVFPANRYFQKFDSTKCSDTTLNKLVSNALACEWNRHIHWDVTLIEDGLPVHGLEYVRVTDKDEIKNKIISNYYGWLWTIHEQSTIQNYEAIGYNGGPPHDDGGPPHDLHPVDVSDDDTTFNKVVNNNILKQIINGLGRSTTMTINRDGVGTPDEDWVSDGDGGYEATLTHNLDVAFPNITCYVDTGGTWAISKAAEVVYVNSNSVTIRSGVERPSMTVRISD